MPRSAALRWLFALYLALTAGHLAFVVAHEPFAFDAWNVAVDTHAQPFTFSRFFEFWRDQYLSSNPRLGQPLTYLAYKLHGVAEVGTPLAFLALVGAAFVLGLGRWPSWRRGSDLALLTIATGTLWFAAPELPAHLFCRAYAANYVWAAAIQLWFVAAIRLHLVRAAGEVTVRQQVALLGFGVVAGLCNEHTGPTLVAGLLGVAWWSARKHGRWPRGLLAGAAGAAIGFLLLFFAPGQGQRYDGLAQRASMTGRLLSRGLRQNLDIFDDLLFAAAPLLVLMVVAIVLGELTRPKDAGAETAPARRQALWLVAIALAAGVAMTVTIFVSPKLGTRFYLHSMLLLLAAFLAVLSAFVERPRWWAPFVVVAVLASAYAAGRTIPLYHRLAAASSTRLAELAATEPGSAYTARGWEQIQRSWWFLGDDFRDVKKRELITRYFGLRAVLFRGADQDAPLWVTDLLLAPRVRFSPARCLEDEPSVGFGRVTGRDVPAVQASFREAATELLHAGVGTPEEIELAVKFAGRPPPLPEGRLLAGRWRDGRFQELRARIDRAGRSRQRTVVAAPALAQSGPWQIYVALVGEPPRLLGELPQAPAKGPALAFEPWQSGVYWVLACGRGECWIVAATYFSV